MVDEVICFINEVNRVIDEGFWVVLEIGWFLIIYLVFENYLFSKTNLPYFGSIVAIKLRVYISYRLVVPKLHR